MRTRTAAAVAAALALSGCPWHPRQPEPQTTEGRWAVERDNATRRVFLYDGVDHKATATATHLSLAVREARARRLAKWLGWSPAELDDRIAQEQAAAAAAEEFIVAFYTSTPEWNDLDAPKSVWRIALKAGGADLVATHVTSVEMDATLIGLFPYFGPFDVAYIVTFPRPPGGDIAGQPFVVDVASALGRISLDWGAKDGSLANKPVQPSPSAP